MKIQISASASSSGADKAYENFKVHVNKYLQQTSLAKFSKATSDGQVFPSASAFSGNFELGVGDRADLADSMDAESEDIRAMRQAQAVFLEMEYEAI